MDAPHRDPGGPEFDLDNATFVFGDPFVEIDGPVRTGTPAGRLLERRGDCGCKLILQPDDFERELAGAGQAAPSARGAVGAAAAGVDGAYGSASLARQRDVDGCMQRRNQTTSVSAR